MSFRLAFYRTTCPEHPLTGCGKTLSAHLNCTDLTSVVTEVRRAGCSKSPSSKATASLEARRTLQYVEPLSEARTPLADFFSILLRVQRPGSNLLAAGTILTVLFCALYPEGSLGKEIDVFQQFTQHIGRQIHKDKQDFAQANNCVSWFYKSKKTPRPAVQGVSWNATPSSQPKTDCHRTYPGGIDDARDDLAKTQALLSVSLTFYEFALVADQNDDGSYSPAELRDLFRSLSLSYDDEDPTTKQVTALTERFDSWYHKRNMDALMQGMSDLYERGYRVTPSDRVELDRVMG